MHMHRDEARAVTRGFSVRVFLDACVRRCCSRRFAAHSAAALAQVNATGDYLSRMDSDHDGRVALIEYQDWMSYAFTRWTWMAMVCYRPPSCPAGAAIRSAWSSIARSWRRRSTARTGNRDGFLDARELAAPPQ